MMDLSLGECEALVGKAARGVGLSWGLAQDAAHAASWLVAHGFRNIDFIAQLLRRLEVVDVAMTRPQREVSGASIRWSGEGGMLCPFTVGASLADFGDVIDSSLENVLMPIVLLPFIDRVAVRAGRVVQAQWHDEVVVTAGHRLLQYSAGVIETASATVLLRCIETRPAFSLSSIQRAAVTDTDYAFLNSLAHRTYVPATAQSRLHGAG